MRIQDFAKSGGPASEAESGQCIAAELYKQSQPIVAGVWGSYAGCGSFWIFNAQMYILPHSRDFFCQF